MDEATLTQTGYLEAKRHRMLYANKFSKKAALEVQHLVREQVRFISGLRGPDCQVKL